MAIEGLPQVQRLQFSDKPTQAYMDDQAVHAGRASVGTSGRRQRRPRTAVAVEPADPTEHRLGAAGFLACSRRQGVPARPRPQQRHNYSRVRVARQQGRPFRPEEPTIATRDHTAKNTRRTSVPRRLKSIEIFSYLQARSQTLLAACIAGCQGHSDRQENSTTCVG